MSRIGIDVGGSFTDVVMIADDGKVYVTKVPSTPTQIEAGFMEGLRLVLAIAGAQPADVGYLAHGTTVATNAIVQRSFARTALVTNWGFTDVLAIGTQMRASVYDLWTPAAAPLVPREWCHGVHGRIDATGSEREALNQDDVRAAAQAMRANGIEAVAVMTLFSFLNPTHERLIGDILRAELPDVPITLSCDVVPEFREYVRAATTVANAALLPLVGAYINAVENEIDAFGVGVPLHLMQSNGGVTPSTHARSLPIALAQLMARRYGGDTSATVMSFHQNTVYLVGAMLFSFMIMPFASAPGETGSLAFLTRAWAMPDATSLVLMAATGPIAVVGTILLTKAYREAPPGAIAPIEYLALLWAACWGFLFFDEVPSLATLVGAALIIGSGIFAITRGSAVARTIT